MSIFYKAQRLGQYGKPFTMYKFRTMVKNADKIGGSSTSDDDPRITKIGRFLRKTKLDELPQLINLLKGDMKLIGWRPEALEYLNTFDPRILETKPGIIGLATLWDSDEGAMLAGSLNPDEEYVDKILPMKRSLELQYIQQKSIWLDLQIIFGFIKKILHVRPQTTGDPSKIESS